jgi:hypothetical protein
MGSCLVEEEQKSVQQVVPACPHIQLLVTNLELKKNYKHFVEVQQ